MPWIVYDPQLDEEEVHMPIGAAYMIVSGSAATYTRSINQIRKEITLIFKRLHLHNILIMGAQDTPWRFRQRRYTDSRVTSIMDFFTASGIRPRFNGAVLASLAEMPTWLKHVMYSVKVNALVPEMHFLDVNQSLYFSPCQYGNLHLTIVDASLIQPFRTEINRSGLILISPDDCVYKTNKNKRVPGRQTSS
jgi:hypothetical protein